MSPGGSAPPFSKLVERAEAGEEILIARSGRPVALEHVLGVADLPPHHADPFDRLLIAQARVERLAIVLF